MKTVLTDPQAKRSPEMNFFNHLDELRGCLVRSAAAFFLAAVVVYQFIDPFLSYIVKPVGKLVFTSPSEAFLARVNLTLLGGFILSSPYVFFQFWNFIAVGLKEQEKKAVILLFPASVGLFFAGSIFSYLVVIPFTIKFFLGFSSDIFVPMITVNNYISFIGTMVFGFGIAFELPLVLFFLAKIGVATSEFLAQQRRYAVVLILILSAIITPPDVLSMLVMAGPLLLLYEAGIWVIRWSERKKI